MKKILVTRLAIPLWIGLFTARGAEPQPEPAIPAIVHEFDKHPIVALAEGQHAVEQFHAFYRSLITNPAFLAKVNDVVIEFGNSLYQPVLDRYILKGEDIPFAELAPVWRSCPHNFAWEGPAYPEFLKVVHDMNKTLPPERRLRLLAGDAPIDWAKIQTQKQWAKLEQDRDPSFSRVIDKQVLKKHRKALVIMGANHLTRSGDRNGDDDTTTLVEARHPGSVYVVMVLFKDYPETAGWQGPFLLPVNGTWLSRVPQKIDADAAVYVAPRSSLTMTYSRIEWNTYDKAYLEEIDRRHRIIFGCSFNLEARKTGPDPYRGWPCH
jgi:hypothetical protein